MVITREEIEQVVCEVMGRFIVYPGDRVTRACERVAALVEERMRTELEVDEAFYKVTVVQRDAAWLESNVLRTKLEAARDAIRKMYVWVDKFEEAREILSLPAVRVAVEEGE